MHKKLTSLSNQLKNWVAYRLSGEAIRRVMDDAKKHPIAIYKAGKYTLEVRTFDGLKEYQFPTKQERDSFCLGIEVATATLNGQVVHHDDSSSSQSRLATMRPYNRKKC